MISQTILRERLLTSDSQKKTLQEIAALYQVSTERVRQIEKQAITKLQRWVVEDA